MTDPGISPSSCDGPRSSYSPSDCPTSPQLQLYQTIIFATPVLFAFILLLLFCLFYQRRRRSSSSIHSQMRAQFFAGALLVPPPLHHGLSRSTRQRLPVVPFDDKFASTCQDTQCSVCLGDYQPNEKLHQLPLCNHSFHVQCIDEWLAKNTSCPICRTSLEPARGASRQDASQEATSTDMLLDNRLWEERVMSPSSSLRPPIEASSSSSREHTAASQNPARPPPEHEHAVTIERS